MDEETLNMYPVGTIHGGSRLKPQIVVTPWWYDELMRFISALQFLADGTDINTGKPIEPDLRLKQILIEHQFDNHKKWAEPLYYPLKEV